jgi:hypothetical protein
MKARLPIVLSVIAVVVAVGSATPLGQAARDAITPKARFALNSDRVDGIHASRLPKAGRLLALGTNKKFPASVMSGLNGLETLTVATAQDSSTPKVVLLTCPAGKRPVGASFRVTGGGAGDAVVTETYASSISQWTIRAVEATATGATWMLNGVAYCVAGT